MNQKREKGITLIALVITIIVLLILAGVTINMVLGDEGIITNAQESKQQHTEKTYEETIELAYLTHRTRVLAKDEEYTYKNDTQADRKAAIEAELDNVYGNKPEEYVTEYGENLIATINSENFFIGQDGKVEKVIKFTINNEYGIEETYYAKEGYSWLDWVNDDKLNKDEFVRIDDDEHFVGKTGDFVVCTVENRILGGRWSRSK